jgi:hypothetical protein
MQRSFQSSVDNFYEAYRLWNRRMERRVAITMSLHRKELEQIYGVGVLERFEEARHEHRYAGDPSREALRVIMEARRVRMNVPDLETMEGQLAYLTSQTLDAVALKQKKRVDASFLQLWNDIATALPDGPGKTRALLLIEDAHMGCNKCVAMAGA